MKWLWATLALAALSFPATAQTTSSALTQLEIEMVPTARDPAIKAVYLKNKDTSASIIGALTATGSKNFRVETLSRGSSRNVFPQQFEVRVAPGQKQYIGTDHLRHFLGDFRDDNLPNLEQIRVSYTIDGARYVTTEPYPFPKPGALLENVFVYEVDSPRYGGRTAILTNINHVFAAEYELDVLPGSAPDANLGQTLMPMQALPAYFRPYGAPPPAWKVIKERFFLVDDAKLRLIDFKEK